MSDYNARRVPNINQYLRELNTIPTEPEEDFSALADDLSIFTNTNFFDFETGTQTDFQQQPPKPDAESPASTKATEPASATSILGDYSTLDFMTPGGDYNFGDFNSTYASPTLGTFPDSLGNLQPIQPNPQAVYSPVPQQHASYPSHNAGQPKAGEKRKAVELANQSRPMSLEEVSRLAAEEDKRRRNTAASARFRVKKKQREQALEKNAREMSEKVSQLESKIQALETENKWLKTLVLEKNEGKDSVASLFNGASKKDKKEADKEVKDEIEAKTTEVPSAKKVKV